MMTLARVKGRTSTGFSNMVAGIKRRKGMATNAIIGIVFALILAAALLPVGLGMWIGVTAAGGAGENWTTAIKTIWNVAPIMIIVSVVAGFVYSRRG